MRLAPSPERRVHDNNGIREWKNSRKINCSLFGRRHEESDEFHDIDIVEAARFRGDVPRIRIREYPEFKSAVVDRSRRRETC